VGTAAANGGDDGESEAANGAKTDGGNADEGGAQLLLSCDAEASHNARRPSSSLVKARAGEPSRPAKTDGASTCS
jgi:hypothetical protein